MQYYEKCENCFSWNESVKKAIKEFGFCNQTLVPKIFHSIKNIIIANEQNPRICFCKDCWNGIKNSNLDD